MAYELSRRERLMILVACGVPTVALAGSLAVPFCAELWWGIREVALYERVEGICSTALGLDAVSVREKYGEPREIREGDADGTVCTKNDTCVTAPSCHKAWIYGEYWTYCFLCFSRERGEGGTVTDAAVVQSH